ncbi:MAG: hypothetical protein AB1730_04525 [Myxococcota bacterium]
MLLCRATPGRNTEIRALPCVAGSEQCPNPNPTPDSVSCVSQLNFFGRRIDVSQTTVYNNNP